MRTLRFLHVPTGARMLIGERHVHVASSAGFRAADALTAAWQGLTPAEWMRAGAAFDGLFLWPAPGTRFPTSEQALRGLEEGSLEFEGFLDAREQTRLARGDAIPARRTALERHLTAFDYRLRGELGFFDLYRAFRASLFPVHKAALKALGALIVFGHGRSVKIDEIGQRRPAERTGGYDRAGEIDEQVLGQFDVLFAASEEVEQERMRRFVALNFQAGRISKSQWESFFATCSALNHRTTVTRRQLRSLFDGSLAYVTVSHADARGKRLLEKLVSDG